MSDMYSFSKLSSFHTCQLGYNLRYNKGIKGEQNIYATLGTSCHECIEALIKDEIDTTKAIAKFKDDLFMAEAMEGMEFPKYKGDNTQIRNKYVECIESYFKVFELYTKNAGVESIEEYFILDICDVKIQGYIDYYYITGNDLYVIDFKTSSKFTKSDFKEKKLQLVLYGMYLERKYPNKKIHLAFDMLKYTVGKRGGLVERNKFDLLDSFNRAMVDVPYNDETKKELTDFISSTVEQIKESQYTQQYTHKKELVDDFFCTNLCGKTADCVPYQHSKQEKIAEYNINRRK